MRGVFKNLNVPKIQIYTEKQVIPLPNSLKIIYEVVHIF